jgi:acetolactate synthase I/II/III large subunit
VNHAVQNSGLESSRTELVAKQAAELLFAARAPLVVAGYGAVLGHASAGLLRLAERLAALRVVATPRSKGVFPEAHPAYLGVVGFAGHAAATQYLFERADCVLLLGTRLGELTSDNWDPRWTKLRLIRVDIDLAVLAQWCSPLLAAQACARQFLCEVHTALDARPATLRSAPEPSQSSAANAPDVYDPQAQLNPLRLMAALNRSFPAQGHIFCGIGNTMAWAIHALVRSEPDHWHVNLNSGAMGHAIPAAIGASFARSVVLAVVGDAEFLMTGFELHTAVERRSSVVVVVLNDAGHGMVRIGRQVHAGGIAPGVDFERPVDLVQAAKAMGARAERTVDVAQFEAALFRALHAVGPTVIDVPIRRDEQPPLGARLAALSHAFGAVKEGT